MGKVASACDETGRIKSRVLPPPHMGTAAAKRPGSFAIKLQVPNPPHAESGHADAIAVNSETMGHIVQQPQQGIRLLYFSLNTLGRNKHEKENLDPIQPALEDHALTFSKSFPRSPAP